MRSRSRSATCCENSREPSHDARDRTSRRCCSPPRRLTGPCASPTTHLTASPNPDRSCSLRPRSAWGHTSCLNRPTLSSHRASRVICFSSFVGTTSRSPKWIKPQLTHLVDEPPTGYDWLQEIKYDGARSSC